MYQVSLGPLDLTSLVWTVQGRHTRVLNTDTERGGVKINTWREEEGGGKLVSNLTLYRAGRLIVSDRIYIYVPRIF